MLGGELGEVQAGPIDIIDVGLPHEVRMIKLKEVAHGALVLSDPHDDTDALLGPVREGHAVPDLKHRLLRHGLALRARRSIPLSTGLRTRLLLPHQIPPGAPNAKSAARLPTAQGEQTALFGGQMPPTLGSPLAHCRGAFLSPFDLRPCGLATP